MKIIKDVINVWKLVLKDMLTIDFFMILTVLYFIVHIVIALTETYFNLF